jgi:drug/metabolite transporter (DMT)-like permease
MKRADLAALLLLGALWGGSFLFMRMGASEFGSWPLAGLRAIGAALCFLPLLASRRRRAEWQAHWKPLAVLGLTNSALPFALFTFAAQSLSAGLASIIDALTPMFVALIGWLWLGQRLEARRVGGLVVGLAGVLWLVGGTVGWRPDNDNTLWPLAACIAATLSYGHAVNYSRQRLGEVSPLVVTAGSHAAAALLLTPTTIWLWPATSPHLQAWLAMLALAVLCTALAYVLFFRLIARIGAARTMTVPYLIPAFGVLWGVLLLGETITTAMVGGCGVILLGTALTTGRFRRRAHPSARLPGGRKAAADESTRSPGP